MATATLDSPIVEDRPTTASRAADVVRRAAHVNHQVKMLKTVAGDAAEDAMYAARRTATLLQRRAVDTGDALVYRVKRHPVQSLLITFGAGLLLGVVVGRPRRAKARAEVEDTTWGCP